MKQTVEHTIEETIENPIVLPKTVADLPRSSKKDNAYNLTPLQQAKKEAELQALASIHPEVPTAFREWLYDFIYHELGEKEFARRVENGIY